ncbi:hypothetical protein MTR_8g463210 [Medicago truncatula]|uniref:Uncharacterized protein n=1 Tax=Medicago truncatula TaxID=3880 RepID=A0A072TRQ7_MEDTR|nr:hypothetical protein MTR_8g463210 [Medicago truncatula]
MKKERKKEKHKWVKSIKWRVRPDVVFFYQSKRRDRANSLGVRDTQPSVTTAISRSNNRF